MGGGSICAPRALYGNPPKNIFKKKSYIHSWKVLNYKLHIICILYMYYSLWRYYIVSISNQTRWMVTYLPRNLFILISKVSIQTYVFNASERLPLKSLSLSQALLHIVPSTNILYGRRKPKFSSKYFIVFDTFFLCSTFILIYLKYW